MANSNLYAEFLIGRMIYLHIMGARWRDAREIISKDNEGTTAFRLDNLVDAILVNNGIVINSPPNWLQKRYVAVPITLSQKDQMTVLHCNMWKFDDSLYLPHTFVELYFDPVPERGKKSIIQNAVSAKSDQEAA